MKNKIHRKLNNKIRRRKSKENLHDVILNKYRKRKEKLKLQLLFDERNGGDLYVLVCQSNKL
jgi:hypothetical protein